ncbi:hypothetical protein [Stenotrophomonas maltophilia]|uniref:hypothetical protein n=2 Tax=Stenotrophomonas maltophilia TaxID=40324 RepID=UPI000C15D0FD|nr:hypothetical protein [Stenotrophomonas maltophilia]QNA96538.1 hypothetical protein G4G30_15080 [Stenotrophomonas maltophilia]HDS1551574.1 hypothetical protein [Stenotrophomonas maltophilia]
MKGETVMRVTLCMSWSLWCIACLVLVLALARGRRMASCFGYGRSDALPRGRSWLRVTVLKVDPALAEHPADIELQPPLDLLKLTDLDYLWLWPPFWKMAALFLLIPGAALAVITLALRRWQRRASVPPTSAADRD